MLVLMLLIVISVNVSASRDMYAYWRGGNDWEDSMEDVKEMQSHFDSKRLIKEGDNYLLYRSWFRRRNNYWSNLCIFDEEEDRLIRNILMLEDTGQETLRKDGEAYYEAFFEWVRLLSVRKEELNIDPKKSNLFLTVFIEKGSEMFFYGEKVEQNLYIPLMEYERIQNLVNFLRDNKIYLDYVKGRVWAVFRFENKKSIVKMFLGHDSEGRHQLFIISSDKNIKYAKENLVEEMEKTEECIEWIKKEEAMPDDMEVVPLTGEDTNPKLYKKLEDIGKGFIG